MNKPLAALLSALAVLVAATAAHAQQATIPPLIKMVVPFAAGASTDVMARAVAAQLAPRLGTNIVVENRAGASGMIGSATVVNGPKDGSQILFTSVSMISTAATTRNNPFDVTKDLVPVAVLYEAPLLIAVNSKSDIKTPAEFVAAARAKPDQITHGTAGVGTFAHLAAELLNDAAKIQLRHIPYKGASLAVTDVIGGSVDAMLAVNSTFSSQIKGGRMRALAVTSLKPSPAFPGLPTMASVVPGYHVELWTAIFVPAGTPPALVQRLNREINEAIKAKEVVELMQSEGATPLAISADEAGRRVRDAYVMWKRVATSRNIVLE